VKCERDQRQVRLAKQETLICHKDDGTYCRSEEFYADPLDRSQAMALLIIDLGVKTMAIPSGGKRDATA
jgi:hypothetical protein